MALYTMSIMGGCHGRRDFCSVGVSLDHGRWSFAKSPEHGLSNARNWAILHFSRSDFGREPTLKAPTPVCRIGQGLQNA